jgi:hypothetical protein
MVSGDTKFNVLHLEDGVIGVSVSLEDWVLDQYLVGELV